MSETGDSIEQRIRERAYTLWEQEGRPEGRAEEFWSRARQEVQAQTDRGDADMAGDRVEGDRVDQESADSFPASDAPSHSGITGPGR